MKFRQLFQEIDSGSLRNEAVEDCNYTDGSS